MPLVFTAILHCWKQSAGNNSNIWFPCMDQEHDCWCTWKNKTTTCSRSKSDDLHTWSKLEGTHPLQAPPKQLICIHKAKHTTDTQGVRARRRAQTTSNNTNLKGAEGEYMYICVCIYTHYMYEYMFVCVFETYACNVDHNSVTARSGLLVRYLCEVSQTYRSCCQAFTDGFA